MCKSARLQLSAELQWRAAGRMFWVASEHPVDGSVRSQRSPKRQPGRKSQAEIPPGRTLKLALAIIPTTEEKANGDLCENQMMRLHPHHDGKFVWIGLLECKP
mmetsp:Transcript_54082/g.125776  ORF Transcript_54082/g.125776 Transcript_54082/m.125776 type:complete len:103 (-) Transcript_54082:80-388(-)